MYGSVRAWRGASLGLVDQGVEGDWAKTGGSKNVSFSNF